MVKRLSIYWDSDNYLCLDVSSGPSPDDDDGDSVTDDDVDQAQDKLEAAEKEGFELSCMIEWDADPLTFADNLQKAAAWLRQVAERFQGPNFHIRTEID